MPNITTNHAITYTNPWMCLANQNNFILRWTTNQPSLENLAVPGLCCTKVFLKEGWDNYVSVWTFLQNFIRHDDWNKFSPARKCNPFRSLCLQKHTPYFQIKRKCFTKWRKKVTIMHKLGLPFGHVRFVHSFVSRPLPTQVLPLFWGAGLLQNRILSETPMPHDLEQSVHLPQAPHWPLTGELTGKKGNIFGV